MGGNAEEANGGDLQRRLTVTLKKATIGSLGTQCFDQGSEGWDSSQTGRRLVKCSGGSAHSHVTDVEYQF